MKSFYLHKRSGIWFAEVVDPATGKKLSARSTGKTDETEARDVVREWLKTGLPKGKAGTRSPAEAFDLAAVLRACKGLDLSSKDAGKIAGVLKARGLLVSYTVPGDPGSQLFNDFLMKFWDYKKSPYVKERLAHGQRITREHCAHCQSRARVHWLPEFQGKRLGEITREDLKAFSLKLSAPEKALSPATRNRILILGLKALRWAFENGRIDSDPTPGVPGFSGTPKARGVLAPQEAAELFRLPWPDERARVASLVAATTGLRCGEIRAMRAEDVGELSLFVRHAYTDKDGLKTPKTGESRTVPLIPAVRRELLALLAKNPNGQNGFIFWTIPETECPVSYEVLRAGLRDALVQLHTGTPHPTPKQRAEALDYWKGRAVSFHSWRHYYSARMADRLNARMVQLATGHHSGAVFQSYADHALAEDLEKVRSAAGVAFGNLLPFSNEEEKTANG